MISSPEKPDITAEQTQHKIDILKALTGLT